MNKQMELELGNNILIFKVNTLLMSKTLDEVRLNIIEQLKENVLVIDKHIEVIVVNK